MVAGSEKSQKIGKPFLYRRIPISLLAEKDFDHQLLPK
jgi:hypothetical protein